MNKTCRIQIKEKIETVPPLPIPFDRDHWGDPLAWETVAPGCYRVDTTGFFRLGAKSCDSLYAAGYKDALRLFSHELLSLCVQISGVCYFDAHHGRFAVEYELCRSRQHLAKEDERAELEEEALEIAFFGAEESPKYFGEWAPPQKTPLGERARYKMANKGVWFVEAGGHWYLSAVYPLISSMEERTIQIAQQQGVEGFPFYAFWNLEDCALAIYELITYEFCNGLKEYLTSMEDLLNYICSRYPEYVCEKNSRIDAAIQTLEKTDPAYILNEKRKIKRTGNGDKWFLKEMFSGDHIPLHLSRLQ